MLTQIGRSQYALQNSISHWLSSLSFGAYPLSAFYPFSATAILDFRVPYFRIRVLSFFFNLDFVTSYLCNLYYHYPYYLKCFYIICFHSMCIWVYVSYIICHQWQDKLLPYWPVALSHPTGILLLFLHYLYIIYFNNIICHQWQDKKAFNHINLWEVAREMVLPIHSHGHFASVFTLSIISFVTNDKIRKLLTILTCGKWLGKWYFQSIPMGILLLFLHDLF